MAAIRDEGARFYLAFDQQSEAIAEELRVTQAAAKRAVAEAYREVEGRDFYETAKAHEAETFSARDQGPQNPDLKQTGGYQRQV